MAANEQTLTDEQFATISANVLHQTPDRGFAHGRQAHLP